MNDRNSGTGLPEKWHGLVRDRDIDSLPDILAEEVVFYSPVIRTPQRGKKQVLIYLAAAFRVFLNESFHYTREYRCDGGVVLEFNLEIDGIEINGVDILRWNSARKITEFKVMLRPLKAINLVHSRMANLLQGGEG